MPAARPANRTWIYAAAAAVLIVAGLAFVQLSDSGTGPRPLLVDRADSVELVRDGNARPLAYGEVVFHGGDTLRLQPGSVLEFTDSGHAGFRFEAGTRDAQLHFQQSTGRLVLQPKGGSLFVTTRKARDERRPIILQTERVQYELLGTTVRLRLTRFAAVLEVLEGPVEVHDSRTGTSVVLEDRMELTISEGDPVLPEPGPLSSKAVAELAGLDETAATARGWSPVVIEEDADEDVEARPVPRFVRLTLQDGRSYEGYLTDQGDTVELRTEHSTITVARNKVKKIEALPDQPEQR